LKKNYFSSHKLPKQQSTSFWSQGLITSLSPEQTPSTKKLSTVSFLCPDFVVFDRQIIVHQQNLIADKDYENKNCPKLFISRQIIVHYDY
jgi:hypothetical protein